MFPAGVMATGHFPQIGGSAGCFAFISQDDIYPSPELAEEASVNDNYDDRTSNSDWKIVADKIKKLMLIYHKMHIKLESRDESKNYFPNKILNE